MEIRQKQELRKLLAPQLRQSLKILALPLLSLRTAIEEELSSNPFLETVIRAPEAQPAKPKEAYQAPSGKGLLSPAAPTALKGAQYSDSGLNADQDYRLSLISETPTLQDALLRQLGISSDSEEELKIGQEIIGNIDENGYLKATLEEIAASCSVPVSRVESVLRIIQEFEPAGVGARTPSECLLIQLELAGEDDPVLKRIVESHLEDVAKKDYGRISKALKEPLQKIEPLIKKILRLDPKPGRNYASGQPQRVIPDIVITQKHQALEVNINEGDIPVLVISDNYQEILDKAGADPKQKEFLSQKLRAAKELIQAISKRQATLRRVIEAVVEIQQEAIRKDFSRLKPLTFKEVAKKTGVHETTVCRVVMNKYVKTPQRVVALRDFFSSHIHNKNGETVSSRQVKRLIQDLISKEDPESPLSDREIADLLSNQHNILLSRRTVTKYREGLRILSSVYRKARSRPSPAPHRS